MASIAQHNDIIKFEFGHNKHFGHVLTVDDIRRMTMVEKRYPISRLPVCGGCERLAYWHKGRVGVCMKCGTITKEPLTLAEYYVKGYDLDKTGVAREKGKEMIAREMIL